MMGRVRIAAVSYLNTIPFIYGIERTKSLSSASLLLSPPSGCLEHLTRGEVDLALIPVAEIPSLSNVRIISDYCLGSHGAVRTVALLHNTRLASLRKIYLDPDSRTSNLLIQVLCRSFWHIKPEFEMRTDHTQIDPAREDCGYILIGDRVFDYEDQFTACLDLSYEWQKQTRLPFVFAAWVAREEVSSEVEMALNEACAYGVSHIEEALEHHPGYPRERSIAYLKYNMDFTFDTQKRKALASFWEEGMKSPALINPG